MFYSSSLTIWRERMQTIGTYLGDCFSNHWLENSETFSLQTESIAMQVARVAYLTKNRFDRFCRWISPTLASNLFFPVPVDCLDLRFPGSI
jgi:hypothetical protein